MLADIPLVFVESLYSGGSVPELEKPDRHHFECVLRISEGQGIAISDGKGSWQKCSFRNPLTEFGDINTQPPPVQKVGVGFCPLKGGRTDMVVAKLTEVGVDYMTPFYVEHSVVKFDERKLKAHMVRWKKIIREASMQCRRTYLPEITELGDFRELSARQNSGHCVVGDAVEEASGDLDFLLVGPEGGWSKEETNHIEQSVSLGPNVLRSDTAAILAGYYLVSQR